MKKALVSHDQFVGISKLDWSFWFRWIFANSIGELVGLGVVAITATLFILFLPSSSGIRNAVVTVLFMCTIGAFNGYVVGFFQAKVLETKIHDFNSQRWLFATTIGTFAAWILGTIPSFLATFFQQPQNPNLKDFNESAIGLAAVGMGFVLGLILGFPQWFELRRYVKNAGWWIWANALAWAIGMPQLFAAPSVINQELPAWQIAFVIFAAIFSAGASVGAIHGLILICLLKTKEEGENE